MCVGNHLVRGELVFGLYEDYTTLLSDVGLFELLSREQLERRREPELGVRAIELWKDTCRQGVERWMTDSLSWRSAPMMRG
jgi:hypothetical protein